MKKLTKEDLLKMGGKEWSKHGHERIYMTCDVFNKVRDCYSLSPVSLSDSKNKFFLDLKTNKVMRSYKNKSPKIEFELV